MLLCENIFHSILQSYEKEDIDAQLCNTARKAVFHRSMFYNAILPLVYDIGSKHSRWPMELHSTIFAEAAPIGAASIPAGSYFVTPEQLINHYNVLA